MDEDQNLWRRFENFLWDFQMGYFTDCFIRTPFGYWMVVPEDDDSLVWRGNADYSAEKITTELAVLGAKFGISNYGVYLSPSWQGDVETLTAQLHALKWQNNFNAHWLVKYLPDSLAILSPPVGYSSEILPLSAAVNFPELTAVHDRVSEEGSNGTYLFMQPKFSSGVERLLALARVEATGEIVGYGLLAYGEEFAYLYALGVVPEHRNRGLAKALVSTRWQAVHEAGIRHAVTAVVTENAASLKVQQGQGYRIFATTSAWQPPGHSSGTYEIAEELREKA